MGEWVDELFITTLGEDRFLVEDVLDRSHGRGAFEGVLADEDVEEDPDRWCSYTACGQELWQIACQPCPFRDGSGICACAWVRRCRECSCVRSNGPLRKKRLPCSRRWKTSRKRMAHGSGLRHSDEPRGASGPMPSPMPGAWQTPLSSGSQPVVKRSTSRECFYESGPSIWPSRPTVSAVRGSEHCLASGAKGDRARRVSAGRRLLPPPAPVPRERKPIQLGPIRWVDVAGRALRRSWITHWRR
jgi:hypothetical protein